MSEPNAKQQQPREEAAERTAEVSPILVMPRMVETVHHNRQRKNHRRQIEHDRAAQAAVLRGDKPPKWSFHDERDEDDDMGDTFSIAGDTIYHNYYPAPEPEPAAQPVETPAPEPVQPEEPPASADKPGWPTWVKAAATAAGLLGAGVAGHYIPSGGGAQDIPTTPTTTIIRETQDLGVGVEVVPGGANDR